MFQHLDVSEVELFFNFMDELKTWVIMNLERRDVNDTATTLTVADRLVEYSRRNLLLSQRQRRRTLTKVGERMSQREINLSLEEVNLPRRKHPTRSREKREGMVVSYVKDHTGRKNVQIGMLSMPLS